MTGERGKKGSASHSRKVEHKSAPTDGVAQPADEVHVGVVQLPRALAHPQHVAGAVVESGARQGNWGGVGGREGERLG